jgi:hypothetical protein
VYDDDDDETLAADPNAANAAAEQAKKDEQARDAAVAGEDLVPKFTRALNAGMTALDSFQVPPHVAQQLSGMAANGAAPPPSKPAKASRGSDSESGSEDEDEEPASPAAAAPISFANLAGSRADPWNSRALPFVIGTRSFLEDDTLGLEIPSLDGQFFFFFSACAVVFLVPALFSPRT